MHQLTPRQIVLLVLLTVVWGVNWPVMKLGVTQYPALSFRALSMLMGLPVLALGLVVLKVPFRLPRKDWPELLLLATTNMFVWHVCIILAVRTLSSGRAAILGYTMPIFSALIGALFFCAVLARRAWLGVGRGAVFFWVLVPGRAWLCVVAVDVGVLLLLWHEFSQLAGRPGGVALALLGAAAWALGTQLLRRTRIAAATLTIAFWMTALTTVVMCVLATVFERDQWAMPNFTAWWTMVFNALLIFGFAHAAWFSLARSLPPVASTLSVMFIPVLGVFSGAAWLGESVHWQDWTAVALMVAAIASVLWPARPAHA